MHVTDGAYDLSEDSFRSALAQVVAIECIFSNFCLHAMLLEIFQKIGAGTILSDQVHMGGCIYDLEKFHDIRMIKPRQNIDFSMNRH